MIKVFLSHPEGQVIYIAPTKSLCSERTRDWKNKFIKFDVNCERGVAHSDHA